MTLQVCQISMDDVTEMGEGVIAFQFWPPSHLTVTELMAASLKL